MSTRRTVFVAAGVAGAALMLFVAAVGSRTMRRNGPSIRPRAASPSPRARWACRAQGRFKTFKASVKFDPDNLDASAVEVIVDAASADAGNPDIDKELKQEKWFDVARFPTVRFATTAFRTKTKDATGKGVYEAVARLTIRDVTEEVVLPFKLEIGPDPADPAKLVARVTGDTDPQPHQIRRRPRRVARYQDRRRRGRHPDRRAGATEEVATPPTPIAATPSAPAAAAARYAAPSAPSSRRSSRSWHASRRPPAPGRRLPACRS